LPVYEKASYQFALYTYERTRPKSKKRKDPSKAARDAFESGYNQRGDGDDAHVVLCTRGHDPLANARFEALAVELWSPLLNALEEA
jgi:hypothetical protein